MGTSPKAQLSQYQNKGQNGPGSQFSNEQQQNSSSKKKSQQSSGKGLSQSANKGSKSLSEVSKNYAPTAVPAGMNNSTAANMSQSTRQSNLSRPQNSIIGAFTKLEYCMKCQKRRKYVDTNVGGDHSVNNIDNSNSAIFSNSNSEVTNSGVSSVTLQHQISGASGGAAGDPNMSINLEDENHELYYEKIRFLIIDCRILKLQNMALLPNSFPFQIQSECDKTYLQSQVDELGSLKDNNYHICLVGLESLSQKYNKKLEQNSQGGGDQEGVLDVNDFHEIILRFLIDDFQSKGFKNISIIPGGFQQCHDIITSFSDPNLNLINHKGPGNCDHCDRYNKDKYKMHYDEQFSMTGFTDLFSGFKHWYDIAGNKLRSFVNRPTKILGTAGSSTSQQQVNQSSSREGVYGNNGSQNYGNNLSTKQTSNSFSSNSNNNNSKVQNTSSDTTSGMFQQQQLRQRAIATNSTTTNLNVEKHQAQQQISSLSVSHQPQLSQPSQLPSHNSSNSNSIYQSLVVSKLGSESRNQGSHKQKKHQHKTTEDQNKLPMMAAGQILPTTDFLAAPLNQQAMSSKDGSQQYRDDNQPSQKFSEVSLGSLPISFVSSRQDMLSQFQVASSHCSSNVSISSSQNDGNGLRDTISNRKIMSYKLISKVPGDKNSQDNNKIVSISPNSQSYDDHMMGKDNDIDVQVVISSPPNERERNNNDNDDEDGERSGKNQELGSFEEIKKQGGGGSVGGNSQTSSGLISKNFAMQKRQDLDEPGAIKIEIVGSANIGAAPSQTTSHPHQQQQQQPGNYKITIPTNNATMISQKQSSDLTPLAVTANITDVSKKLGAGAIAEVGAMLAAANQSSAQSSQEPGTQIQQQQPDKSQASLVTAPLTEVEQYYYNNGIIQQKSTSKAELNEIITKKSNIVYKTQKLNLKKKSEQQQTSQQPQPASNAYVVYLVITQYSVSVFKENPNKSAISSSSTQISSQQQQLQVQNPPKTNSAQNFTGDIQAVRAASEEWNQSDFDELNSALAASQTKESKNITNQASNNNQAALINNEATLMAPGHAAMLESRFLMHDLIKITSRKSSAKIITFYFRIPLMADYNSKILENNLIASLDQKPPIKYQFAFKREQYKEVSVSFEFAKEDEAKLCITNVSSIYKKLKSKKTK